MNFFLFHSPVKNLKDKTIKHMVVPVYEPWPNTQEENEFPEDGLRVEYRPIMYAEDCIAAGCPDGIW